MENREILEDEEMESEETYDMSEVISKLAGGKNLFMAPIVEYDVEELASLMETSEFGKGIAYANELAGVYTTLVNYGISYEDTITLLLNKQTSDLNLELQKLLNEGGANFTKRAKDEAEDSIL